MSMDAEDDGLHDNEEDEDEAGSAVQGASCLNINPMLLALPAAGGTYARNSITRTRQMTTVDHVQHVGPALLAVITAADSENGQHVVLVMKKYALVKPEALLPGLPTASGAAAADDGSVILCCGPRGL
jgi:hypothetical protein